MSILKNPYPYQICTADQCRRADRAAIEQFGIGGFTLMESAGLQSARCISQIIGPSASGLYICGKGNNAGDALVTARYLTMHDRHSCTILLLNGENELTSDTAKNLTLLQVLASNGAPVTVTDDIDSIRRTTWDYLVDGMLGTGLESELREPLNTAVSYINENRSPVFSLDIPTGLHTDHGQVMGSAVKADYTLSFGALKQGFYFNAGPALTGEIRPFNLSFPEHLRESAATLIHPELLNDLPPVRRNAEHKYSDGVVYLLAGSEGLTGAAIMAAKSAWSSGAGAVFLFSPRGLLPVYEKALPQVIKCPLGSAKDLHFTGAHYEQIAEIISRHDGTLLMGPGIGRHPDTEPVARQLLNNFKGTVVVDADALHAVGKSVKPDGSSWILTPHPGELKLLGNTDTDDIARLEWSRNYAAEKRITIVSKGFPVIVGTGDGQIFITGYDTRLFSRAGFGDVLSGKIAGLSSISGDSILSVLHSLLDGYQKVQQRILTEPGTAVGPEHLL